MVIKFDTRIDTQWGFGAISNTRPPPIIPVLYGSLSYNPESENCWFWLVPKKFRIKELQGSVISKTIKNQQFSWKNQLMVLWTVLWLFIFKNWWFSWKNQLRTGGSLASSLAFDFWEQASKWIYTWVDNWRLAIPHSKNCPTLVHTYWHLPNPLHPDCIPPIVLPHMVWTWAFSASMGEIIFETACSGWPSALTTKLSNHSWTSLPHARWQFWSEIFWALVLLSISQFATAILLSAILELSVLHSVATPCKSNSRSTPDPLIMQS